jgi:hypothetical protein
MTSLGVPLCPVSRQARECVGQVVGHVVNPWSWTACSDRRHRDDGEDVLIPPLLRRHPGFFDYWEGNWIDCELQIAAGYVRGGFRA